MSYVNPMFFTLLASLLFLSCLLEKDYTDQKKHDLIGTAGIYTAGTGLFFF